MGSAWHPIFGPDRGVVLCGPVDPLRPVQVLIPLVAGIIFVVVGMSMEPPVPGKF